MTRYRGWNGYGRRKATRHSEPAPSAQVDELRDRAVKLSEQRNQLNYAWVTDVGADGAARQVAHYEQLIRLVGDCDTAWRAVAERDGVPYTPCVDVGWLPRYQRGIAYWRDQLTERARRENEEWELTTYDSATHKPAHVRGES